MKTMILAAGRGERMRPLTDTLPKPLLPVGGRPLIERLVESLVEGGLRDIVVNHAHLGSLLIEHLGDGRGYGARIEYSAELEGGLETGGGIFQALAKLNTDPFAVINGDIFTDYAFARLPRKIDGLAHLVMVDNPKHHLGGDFAFSSTPPESGYARLRDAGGEKLTFSGIGVYRHALFKDCSAGKFPLAPLLRAAMANGAVTGEHYLGCWYDVGTPERLAALNLGLKAT